MATSSTTSTSTSQAACVILFHLPTGSYASGATVTAAINAECGGSARWQLTEGSAKISGGTTHCDSGVECTLYSSDTLSSGNYTFSVTVDSGHQVKVVSDSSNFTVTAVQSDTSMVVVAAAGFALVVAVATKDEWSASKAGRGPGSQD
ncbi:MAG: hypothetical protein JRM85_04185 [Nitrososphaerota archaeon]|nr:hypothetical protein [Nitrososphaerota archaeon]MDG6919642.1 hypothetical protein [Nitrososphaerota archaeon]MDG6946835.1 hypothetical protein [Nitrososphaerota archaeon]